MKRRMISVLVWAVLSLFLLGGAGTVFAGVEPSPFQPQISTLHSIDFHMAVIQKGLDTLVVMHSMPPGTRIVLSGIKEQLTLLDAQLADILTELPPYNSTDPMQKNTSLALEGLRISVLSMEDPLGYILWRMGIEPSPWKGLLDSIGGRINGYFKPSCIPGAPCN